MLDRTRAERIITAALAGLPAFFRERIDNLVIIARARPSARQARRHGTALLGLYEGVPLLERTSGYSGVMPDKITIFYRNIEKYCRTPDEEERCVAHTLRHELAHHFGIDDDRLRRTGNY